MWRLQYFEIGNKACDVVRVQNIVAQFRWCSCCSYATGAKHGEMVELDVQ